MKNPHFDAVALARGASGDGQPSALNLIAAAFCCLLAPMGSAIGVLSGPVATLRGFSPSSLRGVSCVQIDDRQCHCWARSFSSFLPASSSMKTLYPEA